MEDNELLERLAALENNYQQDTQKRKFDDFMGQYGSKFGGHRGIGQSFMDRIGGMGVDATEEVVEQLLGELRQDIQTLNEAIGPARSAAAAMDMPSVPQAGGIPPLPPAPSGAEAPPTDSDAPMPDHGASPPPEGGTPAPNPVPAPAPAPSTEPAPVSEPPKDATVSDANLKDIAEPAAFAGIDAITSGDNLGGAAGSALGAAAGTALGGPIGGELGAAIAGPIGEAIGDGFADAAGINPASDADVSDENLKDVLTPEDEAALDEIASLLEAGEDPGIEGLDEGDLAWIKEWRASRAGPDPSDPSQSIVPTADTEPIVEDDPFLPPEDENDILASVLSKRY